jgi:hypothetical protein
MESSITLVAIAVFLKLFHWKAANTMDRVLFKQRQMVHPLPGGEGRGEGERGRQTLIFNCTGCFTRTNMCPVRMLFNTAGRANFFP